jgi:FkbM family methyltransferase
VSGALIARTLRYVLELTDRAAIRVTTRRLINCGDDVVRLGSEYGGWWVPRSLLRDRGVAYCVGAGEDITFDLALLARGFVVRTFDPTPRAVDHVHALGIRDCSFSFLPVALWSEDTTLTLYAPRDPTHVSHSALNLQHTTASVDVAAISLSTAMRTCGDIYVDLLKLDIEGAEIAVLPSITAMPAPPRVLCIEFDAPRPYRRLARLVASLRLKGYRTAHCEGRNVLMVLGSGCPEGTRGGRARRSVTP